MKVQRFKGSEVQDLASSWLSAQALNPDLPEPLNR